MAAPISEGWVLEKLNIQCDNLDDVRSLTLPGSYQEKISSLGSAFRGFARLKKLDVSRNNLESLEGLEQLKILEELNLYYNNISTLEELYRLRHNQELVELDLRLNPVTRTEPDYRLFLIHMLPNLRKLDDRSVRDTERKAALLHFASDQVSEFQEKTSSVSLQPRPTNPRVEFVNDFGSIPALNADDCYLLDTVANHDYDVTKPRKLTGSSATKPHVENYNTQNLLEVVRKESHSKDEPWTNELHADYLNGGERLLQQSELQARYPHIPPVPSHFLRQPEPSCETVDTQQTDDGMMATRGHAHFTPYPDGFRDPESYVTSFVPTGNAPKSPSRSYGAIAVDDSGDMKLRSRCRPDQAAFLVELCNLVDRYWNGSKSLQQNQKFQSLAHPLVSAFVERQMNQEAIVRENRRLEDENHRLRQSLNLDSSVDIRETLADAKKDVELLRDKLKKTYDENQILQDKLEFMQKSGRHTSNTSAATADLERQRNDLEHKVSKLKRRIQELEKVHQLTAMVQEAHKSLLTSNDQLRKEMEESRARHHAEVEQLHWSYNQLKKTAGTIATANLSMDSSSQQPNNHSHAHSHAHTVVNGGGII